MATFLIKSEPGEYSYADLVRDGATRWSGVSNAAALIALRAMRAGDEAFIYHTGKERAVVGLARIATDPYPDPDAGDPRRVVVDIQPLRAAKRPVPLAEIKADDRFRDFALVRQSRLSVMEASAPVAATLRTLAGLE